VVLTNSLSLTPVPLAFAYAVEMRLFELLFDQPAEFDALLQEHGRRLARARPAVALGGVEDADVAPYLGYYESDELGEVRLVLRDGRLILDAGELSSELRQRADADDGYLLHDPPLALYSEAYGAIVRLTREAGEPRIVITVPATVTGPAQDYVFEPQ
jgi:hypothetical protein